MGSVALVPVPDVVGLGVDDARAVLKGAHLEAMSPDPDGPPLAALGWPDGAVVDQDPDPGTFLPAGSWVTLWVERGPGSAGMREPRRPRPEPRSASGMLDEESGEAIG